MRIKFFASRYAWLIVGVPLVFCAGFWLYEKLNSQPPKNEKVEALSNSLEASKSKTIEATLLLQRMKEVGIEYQACKNNAQSNTSECHELAAKFLQAEHEYRQAFSEMDQQMSESNQKFCELLPTSEPCKFK